MKNLDILNYLDKVKDEAYAAMKQDHFNDEGIVYYRGKHDMAFMMRAALAPILKRDATHLNAELNVITDALGTLRKRTILPKNRRLIDGILGMVQGMYDRDEKAETIEAINKEIDQL